MPSKKPAPTRERDIRLRVVRDPGGAILARDKAPVGLRTPNGFVWGHQVDHLVWMPRVPGTNALTVWSRSMLKALGESEGDDLENDPAWSGEPLVPPRVLRPWPVLKVARRGDEDEGDGEGEGEEVKMLNQVDEGCDHEHVGIKALKGHERTTGSDDGNEKEDSKPETQDDDDEHVRVLCADLTMMALMGECPDDPEELCTGPIVFNRLLAKNARGEPYAYVWCEHFREQILAVPDPQSMVVFAVAATGNPHLDADTTGIRVRRAVSGAAAGEGSAGTSSNGKGKACGGHVPREEDKNPSDKAAADNSNDVPMSEATVSGEDSGHSIGDGPGNSASETASSASARDLYSVEGLPKLEEFIPDGFLPDVLMVHDPDNTTKSRTRKGVDSEADSDKDKPVMYKRCAPKFADPERKEKESVAHLYLRKANRFGLGNHSHVYRAPLTLPQPLTADSPTGQVTVAAKLAYNRCSAHHLLHNEARVYDTLSKDMQEDWCGYNVVPQCRYPVPVGAIAPKFFGYYLPVDADGLPMKGYHPECTEERPCDVKWASPILLMEECGNPVEPDKFTLDQRTECFSLILRLHHMDIVQGSFYVRNIMCQPGPLTLPPAQRSYDTPSFRIIDFGRGKSWDWELDQDPKEGGISEKEQEKRSEKRDKLRREFRKKVVDEVARARRELLVPDFAF
ncbi:hypothetical protein GSI_08883 [Ganoderma sinense ZZ0214-1]|uniref:Protein kinase domain-containing protein n=1 Tax=Ganoderma sinense ZZ0214-1 TaxID=1077348 RepID=A0A2G8S5M5_9APHY|nr:hypothetical protein GSI_08883 [Ganoderma sinense ZZ0214-1]